MAVAIAGVPFLFAEVFSLRAVSRAHLVQGQQYVRQAELLARQAMLVSIAVSVAVAGLGVGFIHFALPDFGPAIQPMLILCVATVPAASMRVLISAKAMIDRRRDLYIFSIAGLIGVMIYFPAAAGGAVGVACASLLLYSFLWLLQWILWKRHGWEN